MRRTSLLAAILLLLSAVPIETTAAGNPRPGFGLWYTTWWTADDRFQHWSHCPRLPLRGKYSAGDPAIIAAHYAQFRDLGVDFLIMDDTNFAGADTGKINDNIRAWFDFMDARPAAERIPICIAGGAEMRSGGRVAQRQAADFYWTTWAKRPSYFHLSGKPLLLVDTDKNYGPGDFTDERFTVRWTYNGDNHAAMKARRTWGWGAYEPVPLLEECMSIWPGHRYPVQVAASGQDSVEAPREGGQYYVRQWLRVLKAQPQFVTVADWNNFEEETALEDSASWEDRSGYAVPDLYRRITRAYSRLRSEKLVKGEYYRSESHAEVFLFDGRALVYQSAMPHRAAIILVPDETFKTLSRRWGEHGGK
jgi:hypothetical protein